MPGTKNAGSVKGRKKSVGAQDVGEVRTQRGYSKGGRERIFRGHKLGAHGKGNTYARRSQKGVSFHTIAKALCLSKRIIGGLGVGER